MRTLPAGNKLPEIRRALDTVKMLCDKAGTGEELDMNFEVTMGMGRARGEEGVFGALVRARDACTDLGSIGKVSVFLFFLFF